GLALAIHLSARTMALARAWAVLGLAVRKSCDAYRQPAGILPPNTSSVSLSLRVSTTTWTSPAVSSADITGSRLDRASIWPERSAVTAPAPAPTPMKETSDGF